MSSRKAYLARCAKRRKIMQEMRDRGLSLAAIAAQFRISYQAVQSALRHGKPERQEKP